jgi:hypothetical protein
VEDYSNKYCTWVVCEPVLNSFIQKIVHCRHINFCTLVFSMKISYRNITAYFLLLLTASPVLFGVYLHLSQVIIQHEMREKLEQENLVTITIDKSEVKWTHKGKEAMIHGNMFDVESYSLNGGNIQLTGLFDKDEDKLVAQIENTQKDDSDNSCSCTLVFQLLSCFLQCIENHQSASFTFFVKQTFSPLQNSIISSVELSGDTPPPKSIPL